MQPLLVCKQRFRVVPEHIIMIINWANNQMYTTLCLMEELREIPGVQSGRAHHKAEAFLEVNISDAAVSFEEPLHILLSGRRAQTADENTTSAHVGVVRLPAKGEGRHRSHCRG